MQTKPLNKKIESQLDDVIKACIHCGMCLPACPTYLVTGNEANSPRGRIYLINDLIREGEDSCDSTSRISYLDDCLSCLGCESVCPSNIDYHSILDYARKELGQSHYNKGFGGLVRKLSFKFLLNNRKRLKFLRDLYSFVSKFVPIAKLNKLSPNFDKPYKEIQTDFIYKSEFDTNKIVSLNLGCVMDTIYNHVHWDTIELLKAFGYDVYIPPSKCCGALAYHSHEEKIGSEFLEETHKILSGKGYPVVSNSAGCGAFMKSHKQNSELKFMDLIEALNQAPINPLANIAGKGITKKQKAIYHPACHLNHAQGLAYDYLDLLKLIPELELETIPEADLCCGSAGFYNLIKPTMAELIGKRKVENINSSAVTLVITANPGCISQIQAYLKHGIEVKHPATVLIDYLKHQSR